MITRIQNTPQRQNCLGLSPSSMHSDSASFSNRKLHSAVPFASEHSLRSAQSEIRFGMNMNVAAADATTKMVADHATRTHTLSVIKQALGTPGSGDFYMSVDSTGLISINNPHTNEGIVFPKLPFTPEFLGGDFLAHVGAAVKMLHPINHEAIDAHLSIPVNALAEKANQDKKSQHKQLGEILTNYLDDKAPCHSADNQKSVTITNITL